MNSGKTLGKRLKQERERTGVSLRKQAESLGISPAYLVDIEKDRRLPTEELLQKIADLLDVPVSAFDEFFPETPKAVRDWLEGNPLFARIARFLRKAPNPEEVVENLEKASAQARPHRFALAIYESELQAIGLDSRSWSTETGGDLFGVWGDRPIVYFASRAGPNAKREHAHFRLDIDYLIKLSGQLDRDWGLRYFGDWHSHHRLGLQTPSEGDQRRLVSVAAKNSFAEMAEFIVTFGSTRHSARQVVINPYVYQDFPSPNFKEPALMIIEGISPIRSALIAASSLPEQDLTTFSSFSIQDISFPSEPLGRVSGLVGASTVQISERLLSKAMLELGTMCGQELELFREAFGFVVVVQLTDKENIAFALDKNWPHPLLQVDWIDRARGQTEDMAVDVRRGSLVDLEQLKEIYSEVKRSKLSSI